MKKNELHSLTDQEAELIKKTAIRTKHELLPQKIAFFQVGYAVDCDKKFTTCFLKPKKTDKRTFVGQSKRVTHRQQRDRYNEHVGNDIALTRAIRNYIKDECFVNL